MISIYFALILEIMFSCIYEEKNSVQITIFISIKKKSKSRNHLSEERNRQNQWQTYLSFATYLRRIKRKKAFEGKYREKPKYRNWRQSRKKKTKYNGRGKKREKEKKTKGKQCPKILYFLYNLKRISFKIETF